MSLCDRLCHLRHFRRQFDNVRRIYKQVDEMTGNVLDNIRQQFLLPDPLARWVAASGADPLVVCWSSRARRRWGQFALICYWRVVALFRLHFLGNRATASRVGRKGVTKGTVTLYITSLGLSSVCFRCLVNGHRKWVVSCVLGIGDVTAAKDVM